MWRKSVNFFSSFKQVQRKNAKFQEGSGKVWSTPQTFDITQYFYKFLDHLNLYLGEKKKLKVYLNQLFSAPKTSTAYYTPHTPLYYMANDDLFSSTSYIGSNLLLNPLKQQYGLKIFSFTKQNHFGFCNKGHKRQWSRASTYFPPQQIENDKRRALNLWSAEIS